MPIVRSIAAIVVGFLVIGALSFGTDMLVKSSMPGMFDAAGRTDSVGILLLTMAYVAIFAIGGCWLTARLAPSHPMRHALILGALGLLFNIAGAIAMWDTAPAWFHIASLILVMPYAWIGGRLRERQLERSGGATATPALAR